MVSRDRGLSGRGRPLSFILEGSTVLVFSVLEGSTPWTDFESPVITTRDSVPLLTPDGIPSE